MLYIQADACYNAIVSVYKEVFDLGFDIAVTNVLMTLLYILPGFIACKIKRVGTLHLPGLSGLLVYACSPCLVFATIITLDFSVTNLLNMLEFFIATLVLQGLFMAILYFLFRKRFADARYRILTIGSVLGNVGFFGLPIIKALLPTHPEVACYSAVFMISMTVFVFTMAIFCLTGDAKYVTIKQAVLNPSSLAFYAGLAVYIVQGLAQPFMPDLVVRATTNVGSMTTPLCMVILGIRLANVDLKKLFMRPFVYIISFMKLVAFPLFSYALICLFPVSEAFRSSILILCGTPCAAMVLSMAEMYDAEQELSANCVLVSTLLCVITIPLLTLLA